MTKSAITLSQDTLVISGEMTFATASSLLKASQSIFPQQSTWRIDFSQVSNCDSAGLALLLEWIKLAKNQNKPIQFLHLPQQLQSIASAAGLEQLLNC